MKLEDWLPIYHHIVEDLGLSPKEDDEAARLMFELGKDKLLDISLLREKISGRTASVIGYTIKEDLVFEEEIKITAGKTLTKAREIDPQFVPDVHVTDMEEEELLEIKDNCILVLHAHGDNMNKIRSIVPQIPRFVGTTQNIPFDKIYNFGGFTDGDRAALLAQEMGATHIKLYGFDFSKANEKKRRKLSWAIKILKTAGLAVDVTE